MTLEQLNYVIEVSKTSSINKAAINLFISQSSLSQSIQNLEKELGNEIFARTRQGVELTPYGKAFINYLVPIQMQLRQLQNMTEQKPAKPALKLSLANDGFHQPSLICAELFNKYQSAGIRIEQYDSYGDEARELVTNGVADVGVIRTWSCYKKLEMKQFEARDILYHPIYKTKLAVTVGPKNPLYHTDLNEITADILGDFPMIKYGYLDYGPFSDIIRRLGISENGSIVVTSSRNVISEMLFNTNAYYLNALWPDMREEEDRARLRTIPLAGTDIRAELGWIVRRDTMLGSIAQEFVRILEQRFMEYC